MEKPNPEILFREIPPEHITEIIKNDSQETKKKKRTNTF